MSIAALSMRSIGRALMPAAINAGLSATAFRKQLVRDYGSAYRWQNLLADWREFSGMVRWERNVRATASERVIPRAWYTEVDLRRERRYRIHAYQEYYDEETGEVEERRVSWYTNQMKSKGEMEDDYVNKRDTAQLYPGKHILKLEIYAVEHNQTWDY